MTATLALADRLARLERAVASLQEQQPGAEALQPTYLTVDAQGRVSATFSGIVNAQGLTLQADAGENLHPANSVVWVQQSGAIVAQVEGWRNAGAGIDGLDLLAIAGAAAEQSILNLAASDDLNNGRASLSLTQTNRGATASVLGSVGTHLATILDQAGASSFLQLLSAQQLQLAMGTDTVTYAAGTTQATLTIAPGIPRVIKQAFVTDAGTGTASVDTICTADSLGNNTMRLVTNAWGNVQAAGATSILRWLALG